MADVFASLRTSVAGLVEKFASIPGTVTTELQIAADRCAGVDWVGREIAAGRSYFEVQINQLYLAEDNKLWMTFDPLVIVLATFIYNGKEVPLPSVIGPTTLRPQAGVKMPRGMLLQDTRVVGPYPFRGDRISLQMALCRVPRDNLAAGLLEFLEKLPSMGGVLSGVGDLAQIGGAVLKGLHTVFGLDSTSAVAAHRVEIGNGTTRRPAAFFAAFFAGEPRDKSALRVEGNRLRVLSPDGVLTDYNETDFVLYSVSTYDERDDVTRLPFYPLYQKAEHFAIEKDEASWKRAKSYLLSLYQEMILSPDLVRADALRLFAGFRSKVEESHRLAKAVRDMPLVRQHEDLRLQHATDRTTELLNRGVGLLDLP